MSGVEPASPDEQRVYLEQQIELLEKTVGERPIGFRSPIGDWLGEHVPQHLIDLGFVYDSSLQGHDFLPYRLRIGDTIQTEEPFEVTWGQPSELLEIPLHWDTNDFAQFEFMAIISIPKSLVQSGPFPHPFPVEGNFHVEFRLLLRTRPGWHLEYDPPPAVLRAGF